MLSCYDDDWRCQRALWRILYFISISTERNWNIRVISDLCHYNFAWYLFHSWLLVVGNYRSLFHVALWQLTVSISCWKFLLLLLHRLLSDGKIHFKFNRSSSLSSRLLTPPRNPIDNNKIVFLFCHNPSTSCVNISAHTKELTWALSKCFLSFNLNGILHIHCGDDNGSSVQTTKTRNFNDFFHSYNPVSYRSLDGRKAVNPGKQ